MGMLKRMKDMKDMVQAAPGMVQQAQQLGAQAQQMAMAQQAAMQAQAGVTVCLASAFTGMRDVMRIDGGSCASGGPYLIAPAGGGSGLLRFTAWLVASLAGVAVGLAVMSSVITMLR